MVFNRTLLKSNVLYSETQNCEIGRRQLDLSYLNSPITTSNTQKIAQMSSSYSAVLWVSLYPFYFCNFLKKLYVGFIVLKIR